MISELTERMSSFSLCPSAVASAESPSVEAQKIQFIKRVNQFEDAGMRDLPNLSEPTPNNIVLVQLPANGEKPPLPRKDVNFELPAEKLSGYEFAPIIPWGKPLFWRKADGSTNACWLQLEEKFNKFLGLRTNLIDKQTIEALVKEVMEIATDKYVHKLYGLHKYLDRKQEQGELNHPLLFKDIVRHALDAPKLFPQGVPLLEAYSVHAVDAHYADSHVRDLSITLSQEQCASLLACALFGLFNLSCSHSYNRFSFCDLLKGSPRSSDLVVEKLNFLFEYFRAVQQKMPTGIVSFRRVSLGSLPDNDLWSRLINEHQVSHCDLIVLPGEKIEQQTGHWQMDFANKYIGGGVLGTYGAVQEEIRFLCCPEMIVSCLLCEAMLPNEAIFILGAQQFSGYTGYADSLKWMRINMEEDAQALQRDEHGRLKTFLLAMNAQQYTTSSNKQQYTREETGNEIRKCFAGFFGTAAPDLNPATRRPIATGHWGGGVFNGDRQYKALLQLVVASCLSQPLAFTTHDTQFGASFLAIYEQFCKCNVTSAELYRLLLMYETFKDDMSVFDFARFWLKKYKGVKHMDERDEIVGESEMPSDRETELDDGANAGEEHVKRITKGRAAGRVNDNRRGSERGGRGGNDNVESKVGRKKTAAETDTNNKLEDWQTFQKKTKRGVENRERVPFQDALNAIIALGDDAAERGSVYDNIE